MLAAALWPVAALVALGWLLRRSGLIADADWPAVERIVYFVTFPALLFVELARAEIGEAPVLAFATVLLLAQAAMVGLTVALRRPLAIPGPTWTSLLQGVVRWNSYIVIGTAPLVFGAAALPLVAIAIAIMVPFANTVSVLALARHGTGRTGGWRGMAGALGRNPLLLACAAGIVWNLLDLPLPYALVEPLRLLGGATLPIGLMAVGAGLRAFRMPGRVLPLGLAIAGKLVVKPLVVLLLAPPLGLAGVPLGVAVLACAVPTASSSYILARLMRGDAELMAAILTAQTLIAFATLPLIMALVT